MELIERIKQLENTAGNTFPPEILFERNRLYRELKDQLNNIPVIYDTI